MQNLLTEGKARDQLTTKLYVEIKYYYYNNGLDMTETYAFNERQ